ncbi:hypothetical protein RFI_02714, partial [Reticulomyxa filosa]
MMKIKKLFKSLYHLQMNVIIERFHRCVDRDLDFTNCSDWSIFLQSILTSYNITPNKLSKLIHYELVYGQKFNLTIDIKLNLSKEKFDNKPDVLQLDAVDLSHPPLENLNNSSSSLENSNATHPPFESCNNFEGV